MNLIEKVIRKVKEQVIPAERKVNFHKNIFVEGYKEFLMNGTTSQDAYMSLINLYCLTNGRFNERMHRKISASNYFLAVDNTNDEIFGKLNKRDYQKINSVLNGNGYFYFENKLSIDMCSRLCDYALKNPANAHGHTSKIVYDPLNPVSEVYRFDIVDLVNNGDIQRLIMNPALINVARNYLGCEPVFDFPAMWWSTSYKKEASSDAAQLYHFDMDRIKWLKILIYLNDVGPENGPHCYIKGSHKSGNKPEELLKRGYVRINDSDLNKYYDEKDFVELRGKAGAIFAGDTKCWHKGKHLTTGHRLVLEFEYTSSLFGSNYPKLIVKKPSHLFTEFCQKNKTYTSNIKLAN